MSAAHDDARDAFDALTAAAGDAVPCHATELVGHAARPGFLVRGSWCCLFNKHGDGAVVFAPGLDATKLGLAHALHVEAARRVMARVRDTQDLHPYLTRGWEHARHCAQLDHGPEPTGEGRDRLTMRKLFKLTLQTMSLLQDDSNDSFYLDEQVAWVCGFFLRLVELLRPEVMDVHAWMQEQCELAAGRRAPILESKLELDLPCAMEHMLETGDLPGALLPAPKRQSLPRAASALLAPPPTPAPQGRLAPDLARDRRAPG